MKRILLSLIPLLFLLSITNAHTVTTKLYTDLAKTQTYTNEFLWAYVQNKTFVMGEISYNATCYKAQYTGGQANILNVPTGYYDVLFVDGAISWNNVTNCPERVDNYDIWATAQTNLYVNGGTTLDYYVNTTLIAPPRQYFWNTLSFRTILSIIAWVVIGLICFAMAYFTKSGLAVAIMFIILVIIKLLVGF